MSAGDPSPRTWLRARRPPVPEPFADRLLDPAGSAPGSDPRALIAPSLGGALAREGERGGAFRLLAADAWITWAAEEALSSADPEAELLHVLEEVLRAAEER